MLLLTLFNGSQWNRKKKRRVTVLRRLFSQISQKLWSLVLSGVDVLWAAWNKRKKSFINIAPIGWRLFHSQVGCIESAGAKGRKKKRKNSATSIELVLVEPAVQPQANSNKRRCLGPMTHSPLFGLFRLHCFHYSPFLVSATGGFVLSDG